MKVIDNFLEDNIFKDIQTKLLSGSISWAYNFQVNDNTDPKDWLWNTKFCHLAFENVQLTPVFEILMPFMSDPRLSAHAIKRLLLNSYPYTPEVYEHTNHIDYPFPHHGALLNLTTCDGYTFVEGKKIESVENRVILFDPSKPHCGTTTSNARRRVIVNFNYF